MTRIEQKLIDFITRFFPLILLVVVSVIGALLRIQGMSFQSMDYHYYLHPWWETIKAQGWQGLSTQVGNYNIPYQIIILLMSMLPIEPLEAYKVLSIIFDYGLAFSAGLLVYQFINKRNFLAPVITYSLVLCSLTVVFNSSFWSQCDSMYVTFILLSIYFLFRNKHIICFVMLGVAFALKLQFVFILPAFIYYYLSTKKISILHFLIIPAVDILLCLPAVFFGRPFYEIFTIYINQTTSHPEMVLNLPNLYNFFLVQYKDGDFELFSRFAVFFTFAVLGVMAGLILGKRYDLKDGRKFLLTACWASFTCIMLLPAMHERYGYLTDILLIIYAVIYKKNILPAVVCNLVSLYCYSEYLFSNTINIRFASYFYIGFYLYFTWIYIKDILGLDSPRSRKKHSGKKSQNRRSTKTAPDEQPSGAVFQCALQRSKKRRRTFSPSCPNEPKAENLIHDKSPLKTKRLTRKVSLSFIYPNAWFRSF